MSAHSSLSDNADPKHMFSDLDLDDLIERGHYKQRYARHKPEFDLILHLAESLKSSRKELAFLKAELIVRTSDQGQPEHLLRCRENGLTAYRNGFSKGWRNIAAQNPYMKASAIASYDAGFIDGANQANLEIERYMNQQSRTTDSVGLQA